jgi:hypothetical protein
MQKDEHRSIPAEHRGISYARPLSPTYAYPLTDFLKTRGKTAQQFVLISKHYGTDDVVKKTGQYRQENKVIM